MKKFAVLAGVLAIGLSSAALAEGVDTTIKTNPNVGEHFAYPAVDSKKVNVECYLSQESVIKQGKIWVWVGDSSAPKTFDSTNEHQTLTWSGVTHSASPNYIKLEVDSSDDLKVTNPTENPYQLYCYTYSNSK